ncbi:hypothetical protein B0H14DRAFT_2608616 [Mycena olivaceomarginata]|nr:hypothetical protein B0H14DRAFT_2608616 [Mycena olivaceomarginata]
MSPGYWATAEQLTWLGNWMAEFIKRQVEGKLDLFWAPMTEAWFNRFPEQATLKLPLPSDKNKRKLTEDETKALGKAITTRKGQLEPVDRLVIPVTAPVEAVIKPSKKSKSKSISPETVKEPASTTLPADSDGLHEMEDDTTFGTSVAQEKYKQLFGTEDGAYDADFEEPPVRPDVDEDADEARSVHLVEGKDGAYGFDLGEAVGPNASQADEGHPVQLVEGGDAPRALRELRSPPWPAGMGPPLSPAAAGAIAVIERGGTENPTTMAIDPVLLGLGASPDLPQQESQTTSAGSLPLRHPDKTFESWQARLPSHLRRSRGETFEHWQARHPPHIRIPAVLPLPITTPPISSHMHPSPLTAKPRQAPPVQTTAARLLKGLLASYTPAAPVDPLPALAAVATSPVNMPVPPPIAPHAAPASLSSSPSITLPPVNLLVPQPIAPHATLALSSSPPITPPPLVLPGSRPTINHASPPKRVPARKAPAKKASTARTAVKETAAVLAAKVAVVGGPRKRGKSQKEPLPNITNSIVNAATAAPAPAAPVDSPPTHVYSTTNNNRARVQQAAAAEEARARVKKMAKGWVEATVEGATVCACRPAILPDGSRPQPKTTTPKLDASEKALLARAAANSKKRKATTAEPKVSAPTKKFVQYSATLPS